MNNEQMQNHANINHLKEAKVPLSTVAQPLGPFLQTSLLILSFNRRFFHVDM